MSGEICEEIPGISEKNSEKNTAGGFSNRIIGKISKEFCKNKSEANSGEFSDGIPEGPSKRISYFFKDFLISEGVKCGHTSHDWYPRTSFTTRC